MNKLLKDFELNLSFLLDEPDDIEHIKLKASEKLKIPPEDLPVLEVKKRSIDARRHNVHFVLTVGPTENNNIETLPSNLSRGPVIIVGSGPAGLFCAYKLALLGIRSIILDRGKKVQDRRKDLKGLNQHGIVDEDSNYCFGEGGAGTYSDGKLYTRSHKRGNVKDILGILVAHGAKESILTDARPHIGSNKLPKVITSLRENLEKLGVEFLFGSKVVDIVVKEGVALGVILANGQEIVGQAVVVATGHSARDMYDILENRGALLSSKPFAMGVRIEHSQFFVNSLQYGRFFGHEKLPSAYYSLAHDGVFSFCMCPGGWIVPALTTKNGFVINGMSLSRRDSPFANSGLVASMPQAKNYKEGILWQDSLEQAAFKASGSNFAAPAVRVSDFMKDKISESLPNTSYLPGITPADMKQILNSSGFLIAERIKEALRAFDKKMPGYISYEAILVGVESRTSSPVRLERDDNSLEALGIKNLYPIGEGAGYAGGIMSAAMDGMRAAEKIAVKL